MTVRLYTWGRLTFDLTKQAIKLGSPLEVAARSFRVGTTNYAPYITKASRQARRDRLVVFGAGYARILKPDQQMARPPTSNKLLVAGDANAAGDAVLDDRG